MKTPAFQDPAHSLPVVSVVVANFNGGAYLADAIRSVQAQTLAQIEIIVSDDASTDNSVDIVKQLRAADSRIRLLESDRNGGPSAARNRALEVVKGQWVAIVDSDDLIHPKRLATLVELGNHDEADIIADDLIEFSADESQPARSLLGRESWSQPVWVDVVDYVRLNHIYGSRPCLGYLKPILRALLLRERNCHYDETLRITEDFDLIFRLLNAGKRMRIYPRPYYLYRKHLNSVSSRLSPELLEAIKSASLRSMSQIPHSDRRVIDALQARMRSIDTAIDYENLLNALKARNWQKSAYIVLTRPKAAALLRLPIFLRFRKMAQWLMTRRRPVHSSVPKAHNADAINLVKKNHGIDIFDRMEV
jgi:glycosyltransferase involved in cell wall biosynthesis